MKKKKITSLIIMNYFNHCIHYIPEENSEFHNYTNGFVPHLTIHKNLEKPDAEKN